MHSQYGPRENNDFLITQSSGWLFSTCNYIVDTKVALSKNNLQHELRPGTVR